MTPEPGHDLAALAGRYARTFASRWAPVPAELDRAIAADRDLALAGAYARRNLVREAAARLSGLVSPEDVARYAAALLAVPRERFVRPEDIATSAEDAPSPLDREGLATVSAPHAYVLTYGLLGLSEGDHLVELGTGTGYGAALGSRIVGAGGRVTTIEIDPALHARARAILADPGARGPAPVTLLLGDARVLGRDVLHRAADLPQPARVAITYAVPGAPEGLIEALPEGGRLVAPVGATEDDQVLVRWARRGSETVRTVHGAVRYVAERVAYTSGASRDPQAL
jgi:protein-L-isoaspartate(D-aspartate) O-methyltransferase